jgi:hypothetical protein
MTYPRNQLIMRKIVLILIFAGSFGSFVSCQTVNSITVSQIPSLSSRKNPIEVSKNTFTILLIPFGTSYIDDAKKSLLKACPRGQIEGLMCKYQTTTYVPILVYTSEVVMKGYCVQGGNSKKNSAKSTRSVRS